VSNSRGSVHRLTANAAPDVAPVWSPDGTKIAFASSRDGSYDVYVMNADGSNVTRLTTNAAEDGFYAVSVNEVYYGLSWSPDGTQLVFISRRDGSLEVYRMNADGTAQTRLTNTGGLDAFTDW
jgi:Tol biopolymer transport system component